MDLKSNVVDVGECVGFVERLRTGVWKRVKAERSENTTDIYESQISHKW